MGQLQLQIGQVTATKTVDNAKMQAIATLILNNGVPEDQRGGTPQEQLQAVLDYLVVEIRNIARGYRRRELTIEQAAELATAIEEIGI